MELMINQTQYTENVDDVKMPLDCQAFLSLGLHQIAGLIGSIKSP